MADVMLQVMVRAESAPLAQETPVVGGVGRSCL